MSILTSKQWPMPLAHSTHAANKKWWLDPVTGEPIVLNLGERCILMISELVEAMEAERKDLMDDKLPHRKGAEVEMADFVIRCLDLLGAPDEQINRKLHETPNFEYTIEILTSANKFNDGVSDHVLACFGGVLDEDNRADMLMAIINIVNQFNSFPYRTDLITMIMCAVHYCNKFGYDLWSAYQEKMEYNSKREDHKPENRIKEGGKRW